MENLFVHLSGGTIVGNLLVTGSGIPTKTPKSRPGNGLPAVDDMLVPPTPEEPAWPWVADLLGDQLEEGGPTCDGPKEDVDGGEASAPRGPGRIALSRRKISFPNTLLGDNSAPQSIGVTNIGERAVTMDGLTRPDGTTPEYLRIHQAVTIEPGGSADVEITFVPRRLGEVADTLQLMTDDGLGCGVGAGITITGSSDGVATVILGDADREGLVTVDLVDDGYESWPIDNLGRHLVKQVRAALNNYAGALAIFQTVLDSSSENEANLQDVGILYNPTDIVWKLLSKAITSALPGGGLLNEVVKEALGVGGKLAAAKHKEEKRAGKAAVSHELGQFVVKRIQALTGAVSETISNEELYFAEMRREFDSRKDEEAQKTLKGQFFFAAETIRSDLSGPLSVASLFTQISHEWITGTNAPDGAPARIDIRLDDDWKLLGASIRAPRGDRLAEELMNQHGGNLDLRQLAVPMRVYWYPEYNVEMALNIGKLAFVVQDLLPDGSVVEGSKKASNAINQAAPKYRAQYSEQLSEKGVPPITTLDGSREY